MTQPDDPLAQVKQYHQQSKHDFNRYARALGYMDWANQPDPFRRYEGTPLTRLPILKPQEEPVSPAYHDLYRGNTIPVEPLTIKSLSRFFEYSLSITAWKEYGGNRWALRSNPSSGNLHPTEGYLIIDEIPGFAIEPGLYHYAPKEHGLEHRLASPGMAIQSLTQPFPPQTFLIGLSSIHWREAWKYGERAFRYCQHDMGHAIGTLRIAAATLGWRLVMLSGMDDPSIGMLLGLNRLEDFHQAEAEFPELIAAVVPSQIVTSFPVTLDRESIEQCIRGTWKGKANRLSRDNPIPWEIIDDVTKASWKSSQQEKTIEWEATSHPDTAHATPSEKEKGGKKGSPEGHQPLAGHIIHQRRSAVSFDGETGISAERFFFMLSRVMPQADLPMIQRPVPWDALPWEPTIHLAFFVHRVKGIPAGLYMLVRSTAQMKHEALKSSMQEQFVWKVPEQCPEDLPLYLLEDGNAQKIATQVSCWQEIAGDSAFSLGMIAEFDSALDTHGPWFYKRLFWEAGLIGQVLYLEAEAAGVRSTGIGCFFDDPVHRVLGFYPHTTFQSLYHFTVGGPVEDTRLMTLPPYGDHVS